jgi:hypothetical protein
MGETARGYCLRAFLSRLRNRAGTPVAQRNSVGLTAEKQEGRLRDATERPQR